MSGIIANPFRFLQIALLAGATLVLLSCQAALAPPAPTSPSSTTPEQAAKALTQVSVALDWYPWANHTGLYVAKKNGYYRDEGLDVKLYVPSNPEDVLKLVGSGRDPFGISYQTDVLLARTQGIPVRAVAALVQHPLNSILTLKTSGITRPKQLEGKKVGYPGIPSNEPLLATMLEKDGSSFERVELVNVGFDLVPALIGKKVDAVIGAYWVHESILAELEGHPVNIMRVEEWGVPDFYELVLVTNEKMAQEQSETVRRFLRSTGKGYTDAAKDPRRAIDLLVKSNPETKRELEERGIALLTPLWQEGIPAFGWQTRERWQAYADWMQQNKLLTGKVDVEAAFTTEFLPR